MHPPLRLFLRINDTHTHDDHPDTITTQKSTIAKFIDNPPMTSKIQNGD